MTRKIIIDIITSLLVLLFVYAAISKLIDYNVFKLQLGKSPLLGAVAPIVAVTIPVAELTITYFLIRKSTVKLGLYLSFTLLTMFTIYLAGMVLFTPHLPCTCGGILQKFSWKTHITFNLFFVLINGIALHLYKINERIVSESYMSFS